MFSAELKDGNVIDLIGRFDASQVERARIVFNSLTRPGIVNFKELEYISSAGMGVLVMTQKRLREKGGGLKFINVNRHIRDVFRYAGFDTIFEIE